MGAICMTGPGLPVFVLDRPELIDELLRGRSVTELTGKFASCEKGALIVLCGASDMTRSVLVQVTDHQPAPHAPGLEFVALRRVGPAVL